MPEPLNYRPSNSAIYYRPPEAFDRKALPLSFAGWAVLAVCGAWVYATVLPQLNSTLFRLGAVAAVAVTVGMISSAVARQGRVQSPVLAAMVGALLALIAIYASWIAWLHHLFSLGKIGVTYWSLISKPMACWRIIQKINAVGVWSYKGDPIKGIPLLLCWLVEAGAMLTAGVMMPIRAAFGHDPICLQCRTKCVTGPNSVRFSAEWQAGMIDLIERRDFPAMATYLPPEHPDAPELSVKLMSCPACGQTQMLTLSRISWELNRQGKYHVITSPQVNGLLVSQEEAEALKSTIEQIKTDRKAGRIATLPVAEPPAEGETA